MLQVSVPNVSSVFQTYVASMFIWMLHLFHTYVGNVYLNVAYVCNGFFSVLGVLASVSGVRCKCFACFECFVAFECCKTRSDVARVAMEPHLPQLPDTVAGAPPSGRRCLGGKAEGARAVPAWGRTTRATSGQRGPHVGCKRGRPNASVCPDIRTLALPFIYFSF
jgi:hypothetical protein